MSDIESSQHDIKMSSISYDTLLFNSKENQFACAKTSSSFYNVLAIGTAICVCRLCSAEGILPTIQRRTDGVKTGRNGSL